MAKQTKRPAAKKQPKVNEILVSVVLDRSGSMASCRGTTISGYNEYLKGLRADTKTTYSNTLIQFDLFVTSCELTVTYEDVPLRDAADLTDETYVPRGSTPLYDAIGECIRRTQTKGRGVIMVIITDGFNNASQEFTKETIKALIKEKEAEGWTFVFLGADIDAWAVGGAIGTAYANTASYNKGEEHKLYDNLVAATAMRSSAYRQHGVTGQTTSMAFFSDEQKAAIDPRFDPSVVIPVTTTGTSVATTGICSLGESRSVLSTRITPAGGIVNANPPVNQLTQGGASAKQSTFRARKPRAWTTSK